MKLGLAAAKPGFCGIGFSNGGRAWSAPRQVSDLLPGRLGTLQDGAQRAQKV